MKKDSARQIKTPFISIIIPNYNGGATIGKCLEAALASRYKNFEIIVVDDCSEDNSLDIIQGFDCQLIRLNKHSGASTARNTGVLHSKGDGLFFTDADCLLKKDALEIAGRQLAEIDSDVVIGGTYTPISHDKRFFSRFQSVFIHYSETKRATAPDYVSSHAMIMKAVAFKKTDGFAENFFPILEDVEFSHRLRRSGYRLIINPAIMVEHIFNYSLPDSLSNAAKKSMYWTCYSIGNKDLLADSGTASTELKINTIAQFINITFLALWIVSQKALWLYALLFILTINIFINRKLVQAFYEANNFSFAFLAAAYYTMIYPLAVAAGALAGFIKYCITSFKKSVRPSSSNARR